MTVHLKHVSSCGLNVFIVKRFVVAFRIAPCAINLITNDELMRSIILASLAYTICIDTST